MRTIANLKYREDIWLDKPDGWGNAVVIGKNPAERDDQNPTLAKIKCLLNHWDFHMVTVVNTFAVRAPTGRDLDQLLDEDYEAAVGRDNDYEIADAVESTDLIIAAWGQPPRSRTARRYDQRLSQLIDLVGPDRLTYVGRMTGSTGQYPLHPLCWGRSSRLLDWVGGS